ncbi:thiamine-phosphate kinase [Psittacicella hinzii]|uniref:Thiamine-monophosphate kinase n=1 Tax=Psittacicella hinzii TaxID=2028575 RepID=A0A3A1YN72_9GAMM|nr:thiamine-phosphate kinase [Psittacicella hinzii]RIY38916.1 thiamine-phosphate kinase [Psittacicella hinzii]
MALGEFALIAKYFNQPQNITLNPSTNVKSSLGDDCAIVQVDAAYDSLITTDTLVEGSHFYPEIHPYDLGYKSVVVNLSDICSKGGIPTWVTLALTLPAVNHTWLEAFSSGLYDALNTFNVKLIGGDTVRGKELSVTITAHGTVAQGQAFTRNQAQVGDRIFVTGTLGAAYAGFLILQHLHQNYFSSRVNSLFSKEENLTVGLSSQSIYPHQRFSKVQTLEQDLTGLLSKEALKSPLADKLNIDDPTKLNTFWQEVVNGLVIKNLYPQPWIKMAQNFHGYVNAGMDVSDGLLGDLRHICEQSQVNAVIDLAKLPAHPYLAPLYELVDFSALQVLPVEYMALHGGEDYQILFTVPEAKVEAFVEKMTSIGLIGMVNEIGYITPASEQQLEAAKTKPQRAVNASFVPEIKLTRNGQAVDLQADLSAALEAKTKDQELIKQLCQNFMWEHFA